VRVKDRQTLFASGLLVVLVSLFFSRHSHRFLKLRVKASVNVTPAVLNFTSHSLRARARKSNGIDGLVLALPLTTTQCTREDRHLLRRLQYLRRRRRQPIKTLSRLHPRIHAQRRRLGRHLLGAALHRAVFPRLSLLLLFFNHAEMTFSFQVRYDMRGHGRSGKPSEMEGYASKLYADDFAAVCAAFEVKRPVVVPWCVSLSLSLPFHTRLTCMCGVQEPWWSVVLRLTLH
jgi:hypothetical protein